MISKLHYITQDVEGVTHVELARQACKGGVKWVQLRVKNKDFEQWLEIARATQIVCKKYGAKLIVNDNVEIAKRIGADGVHLGKSDMAPSQARRLLGVNVIIGGSTNSIEDVRRMVTEGADYIGVGPFRFTSTKENLNPVLGSEELKNIVKSTLIEKSQLPMIAIGGIKLEDVQALLNIGVHGVAVSSAINLAADRILAAELFSKELNKENILTKTH